MGVPEARPAVRRVKGRFRPYSGELEMTSTIRSLCATGLVIGACVLAAPNASAQGKSQNYPNKVEKVDKKIDQSNRKVAKSIGRTTTARRTRVLCEDGVWVYRSAYTCRSHGGIAARQGRYGTTPRASARARERANENSAVARAPYASSISTGAIARCNDGTYWHSNTRTGACYRHGGVAFWL